MASMGVPGLANFAGELMVFFGVVRGRATCLGSIAVIAIYGTVITAIFQLRAIKNVFYGPMPARFASAAPRRWPPRPAPATDRPSRPRA